MTDIVMPEPLPRTANVQITQDLLCARYNWLKDFFTLNGFLPSNEVIGRGWGGLSRAAVPRTLGIMAQKSLIRLVGTSPRRAIVLEDGNACEQNTVD